MDLTSSHYRTLEIKSDEQHFPLQEIRNEAKTSYKNPKKLKGEAATIQKTRATHVQSETRNSQQQSAWKPPF